MERLFDVNGALLREIIEFAEGSGAAEALAVLRTWRSLSRTGREVAMAV